VRANSAGWGSVEVLGALAGGFVLAVAFVATELRTSEPMLPMRLFRSRSFAAGNAANFLHFGALFSAVFFMAQFQQLALHQSPLQAGLRLVPWTGMVFFVAPLAGRLVDRIGERPFVAAGLLMQAAGLGWVALIARTGLPFVQMVPPLALAGTGASMAIPAMQNAIMGAVAPADLGKASGTFSTTRQLGAAFGLAIVVAVFAGSGSYATPDSFSAGFGPAIGVSAALSLAGAIAGLALRMRPAQQSVSAGVVPASKPA
jgi:MFS family permease